MSTIFLTGGSGLLGRALVERLLADGHHVRALSRSDREPRPSLSWIRGDVCHPPSYLASLVGADVVLHAAAQTGRAADDEYRRVNVEGTRALLACAESAGVRRFIHTSTVAVTYPELHEYPYARSKREADDLVLGSGLDVTVVRPTILLGPDGPALQNLLTLARFPFLIVAPGAGARVRPIHVDDAASSIASLLTRGPREVDLAGEDSLRLDELLRRIRIKAGRGPARVLPVPVRPIIAVLSHLETLMHRVDLKLPIRAGQLYVFEYGAELSKAPHARPLDETLDELLETSHLAELAREAERLSEYLAGRALEGPQLLVYEQAARLGLLASVGGRDFTDELLGLAVRLGAVRPADFAARVLRPGGELRRRLVLLLALLEVDPHARARLDAPSPILAWLARARGPSAPDGLTSVGGQS